MGVSSPKISSNPVFLSLEAVNWMMSFVPLSIGGFNKPLLFTFSPSGTDVKRGEN